MPFACAKISESVSRGSVLKIGNQIWQVHRVDRGKLYVVRRSDEVTEGVVLEVKDLEFPRK